MQKNPHNTQQCKGKSTQNAENSTQSLGFSTQQVENSTNVENAQTVWDVAYGVENLHTQRAAQVEFTIDAQDSEGPAQIEQQAEEEVGSAQSIDKATGAELMRWDFAELEAYRQKVVKAESRARTAGFSTAAALAARKDLVCDIYANRLPKEGAAGKKTYKKKTKEEG